MKKLLLLLLSSIILSSCCTQKRCNKKFPPVVTNDSISGKKDSINNSHTESIKDSIVFIAPDSSWLKASISCDSLGNVYIKNIVQLQSENGKLLLQLKDNELFISNITQPKEITVHSKSTNDVNSNTALNSNTVTKTITVKVNELTWFQKLWIWLGYVMGIEILLFIVYIIFKLYLKFK